MSAPNVLIRIEFAPSEGDMQTPFAQKKYGRARRFYSCQGRRNYADYVNEGSEEKIDYVAYSGDGEKSAGIFGKDGAMTNKQRAALRQKLRETKSVIWYGLLSFTTEFGNKYLKSQEDAIRLMNAEFPRFFKDAGLNPDNITWYAGLHENTLHKHIHFSFFENQPSRYTERDKTQKHFSEGFIYSGCLARFKINVEQRLTDISSELKAARDSLTDIMKNVLFTPDNKRRNTRLIQDRLSELADLLPKDGRMSYASGNMVALRPLIRQTVDLLIKSNKKLYDAFNVFCNAAVMRDERTKEMLEAQRIDPKSWGGYLTADKVLEDMYRRLGNYVINTARVFKGKEKPKAFRAVRKQAKKQATASLMTHCLNLSAYAEQEAMDFFREYIAKLKEEEFKNREQNDKEERECETEMD